MTSPRSQAGLLSLTIHVAVIAFLLVASKQIVTPLPQTVTHLAPLNAPSLITPKLPAETTPGGGGRAHRNAPATSGHLPNITLRQFVPPALEIVNPHPKLAMEMAIEAPPDSILPDNALATLGDPLSKRMNNSAGKGGPLGIGNGPGTGVGDRHGAAAGTGSGGSGTVYRPGHGVTTPVLLHSVEPEFSEDARRAQFSGTVTLRADIDSTGRPRNIRVVHSLGMGLDERATDAVL
jgi:protein TonB